MAESVLQRVANLQDDFFLGSRVKTVQAPLTAGKYIGLWRGRHRTVFSGAWFPMVHLWQIKSGCDSTNELVHTSYNKLTAVAFHQY